MNKKTDIRTLQLEEIIDLLISWDQPKFRGKQIYEWLWKKSATSFDEMTNLSKPLREKLKEQFAFQPLTIDHSQFSEDGTIKTRFLTDDQFPIEGVMIPSKKRSTACVSSQIGCSLSCSFCATGKMKRERNLTAAEIYDQVVMINQQAQEHQSRGLTNIVYMGMGEPLLNYKEVMQSVRYITSEEGLGISPKRITISTAGIAKMIRKMADDDLGCHLALSLHAADDEKRNRIMPINEQNNLASLIEAMQYYQAKTNKHLTFEYILFEGFNDSMDDAKKLFEICKKVPAKINIIEYNPIEGFAMVKPSTDSIGNFARFLEARGIVVNVRRSRGKDIDAACGQLANK